MTFVDSIKVVAAKCNDLGERFPKELTQKDLTKFLNSIETKADDLFQTSILKYIEPYDVRVQELFSTT